MSQISDKVKWCLNKAEKELKISSKHRGLIKIKPDLEGAKKHLIKAEHNLSAIEYFNKGGYSDWSMSAVFYCIYHCFLAISLKYGYESRNQECTITLIKSLKETGKIIFEDRFIESIENVDEKERQETNVIEKREFYTYGTTVSMNNLEEMKKSIDLCKDCLDQTKDIILKD